MANPPTLYKTLCTAMHDAMHADVRDQATHVNEITQIAAGSAALEAEAGRPLVTPVAKP